MDRHYKKWSKEDDRNLRSLWGAFSMNVLMEKLGRNRKAILKRAEFLGLPPRSQGRLSLNEISRKLGYSTQVIHRIAKEVGIKINLRRLRTTKEGYKGRIGFEWEDYLKIEARVKSYPNSNKLVPAIQWGVDYLPESCLDCGKTERRHSARGLCCRCYNKRQKNGKLEERAPVKYKNYSSENSNNQQVPEHR